MSKVRKRNSRWASIQRPAIAAAVLGAAITLVAVPQAQADGASLHHVSAETTKDPSAHRELKPELSPADMALMNTQHTLDNDAAQVRMLVQQQKLTGYGNIVVSPKTGQLFVYWRGTPPTQLMQLAGALHTTKTSMEIRPAAYTEQQLDTAVSTVGSSAATKELGVVTVKPRPDASGIDIGVDKQAFSPNAIISALPQTGVASNVVPDSTPMPIDRLNDTSPFWGGAVILNPTFLEACTSGWPVHFTANPSGEFLLTANHCGSFQGGDKFYTPADTYIGNQIGQNDVPHDTLMIELDFSNSHAGNSIYTGGVGADGQYNGVGNSRSVVAGSATPTDGDYICASGGFSGENCLAQISNTDVQPPNSLRVHMVQADLPAGSDGIAGQGDSGGPVYLPNPDGTVTALGTLSSIDPNSTAPCTGVQGRTCGRTVYFSNIDDALSYYAISLNT